VGGLLALQLLAADLRDLLHDAKAQRHESVEAAAQLADEARADEQLVRGDLGVGRAFLERGDEELGPTFHAVNRVTKPAVPTPAIVIPAAEATEATASSGWSSCGGRRTVRAFLTMSVTRKPWPMRWIVAAILLFIVPYTYVNLKFRKPNRAFEPYADMKEQANVKRLLDAGYTRVNVRAERPYPPLGAAQVLGPGRSRVTFARSPGGLPRPLDGTLVEAPRLPLRYGDLVAPAEVSGDEAIRLQFTATVEGANEQLAGAEIYIRSNEVVVAPTFEPLPGKLAARDQQSLVLLTLPAGILAPGRHTFTLAGRESSLRWELSRH